MTTLFLKTTTAAYTYNGTTLTQVTDPDYPATTVRGAVYLDKRFFVCTPAGNVYQSAEEDAQTWAALEFVGAKKEPDQAKFIAKYQDYIMVLKEWSIEFFYDAANATGSILAPVPSIHQLIGCLSDASVRETAGTVFWLGKTKDGEGSSVYRMAEGRAERVSTPQIDKIIDADALTSVSSWTGKLGAHVFYGLNLDSVSVAYDISTGLWSVFTYLATVGATKTITAIDASGNVTSTAHGYSDNDIIKIAATNSSWNGWHVVTNVSTDGYTIQGTGTAFAGSGTSEKFTEGAFPIKHSTSCGGKQVMQANGKLYEFSLATLVDDVGAVAARIRTVKFDGGVSGRKTFAEAEIIGDKVSSHAVLRYSDDDYQTWSKSRNIDLSLPRSRVRRLGDANRRAFEILHVKDKAIRLEALDIEVGG